MDWSSHAEEPETFLPTGQPVPVQSTCRVPIDADAGDGDDDGDGDGDE